MKQKQFQNQLQSTRKYQSFPTPLSDIIKLNKQMVSKIICLAILICALFSIAQSQIYSSFGEWKSVHAKKYADQAEEHYRAYIYNKNVKAIKAHNSDTTNTFKQAVNKFADKTPEELKYNFLTLLPSPQDNTQNTLQTEQFNENDDEDHLRATYTAVNWMNRISPEFVPQVTNQGSCGSCWAHTSVTVMRFAVASQLNLKANFSIQELVSCAPAYGCDGGSLTASFNYAKTYAVSNDSVYPYTSADTGITGSCNTNLTNKGSFKVRGITIASSGTTVEQKCNSMLSRLQSTNGSVLSISLYVPDGNDFYFYSSGIFNACSNLSPNHAMTLIGNDESGNWLLINSWGVGWGNAGLMWLKAGNTCNICARNAYFPTMYKAN